MTEVSMQINGRPATAAQLGHFVLSNYGAFTSMQVEDGTVRGLDLHLARLDAEARELFGMAVPEAVLRERMRQGLAGRAGRFSLRVNLFSDAISLRDPSKGVQPSVLVTVSPVAEPLQTALRLQTQIYGRELPHLKHNATLGLTHARRAAMGAGFDDALFVDAAGRVSEGSIWNIGFLQAGTVVWPDAPMLPGTGQGLIERGLAASGQKSVSRVIRIADLNQYDGAFVCNSATPACAVASIDGHNFPANDADLDRLIMAWRSNPCQAI